MIKVARIRRRFVLRRMAGGGAIICTLPGILSSEMAVAAPAGGPARRTAPLIMLDAGHGGRDGGASGAVGTLEKDVTLATVFALKAALEARGCYRVELTRTQDQFVSREDRVGMTRDLQANLFLSLHADQLANTSVRGASVYTLAKKASDAETEALANRENGSGEDGRAGRMTSDVSGILASLAARETRAASSRIARQLVQDLERDLPVVPSPERHANFTVLRAAGIPSVLVEMGFLSNPADEAALNDSNHRWLIARSITRAVAWFFSPVA
jgi:N-acetylmuramoyl-L-alanine amidase